MPRRIARPSRRSRPGPFPRRVAELERERHPPWPGHDDMNVVYGIIDVAVTDPLHRVFRVVAKERGGVEIGTGRIALGRRVAPDLEDSGFRVKL